MLGKTVTQAWMVQSTCMPYGLQMVKYHPSHGAWLFFLFSVSPRENRIATTCKLKAKQAVARRRECPYWHNNVVYIVCCSGEKPKLRAVWIGTRMNSWETGMRLRLLGSAGGDVSALSCRTKWCEIMLCSRVTIRNWVGLCGLTVMVEH